MALPRYRSFLGIAKEASRTVGTAPTAVAPVNYIPVNSITPFDNIKYLDDNNWRGSMANTYGTLPGNLYSEFEFGGDVFPDMIGYPLAGLLGADTFTSGTPNTHVITLLNSSNGQAPSYTLTDFYGRTDSNPARAYAGVQFGSVDIKFNADGLLEYTAMGNGFASAVATLPTASFTTVTNVPAWTGTTTLAGSVTALLSEGSISMKRTLTPMFTIDASQAPYQIFQGALEVDGTLKLILEDDTQLGYYLNNTQPGLLISFDQGSGATQTQVSFQMSKCAFQVAKIDRSKDFVELDVTFKAIANTTDKGATGYAPIKVQLKNTIATGIYA
jgi:hypothetical protein